MGQGCSLLGCTFRAVYQGISSCSHCPHLPSCRLRRLLPPAHEAGGLGLPAAHRHRHGVSGGGVGPPCCLLDWRSAATPAIATHTRGSGSVCRSTASSRTTDNFPDSSRRPACPPSRRANNEQPPATCLPPLPAPPAPRTCPRAPCLQLREGGCLPLQRGDHADEHALPAQDLKGLHQVDLQPEERAVLRGWVGGRAGGWAGGRVGEGTAGAGRQEQCSWGPGQGAG